MKRLQRDVQIEQLESPIDICSKLWHERFGKLSGRQKSRTVRL